MMRVALARLLLARPDVLLLDEPTNHLDLASVTWLEGFLADYPGAIILVSHDRDFINAFANRVVEIADGTATEYTGDYADFIEQREQRLEQLRVAAANQQRKVARTEQFIERFRYKASQGAPGAKPRQGAGQARAHRGARPGPPKVMRLKFPPAPRSGRDGGDAARRRQAYGDKSSTTASTSRWSAGQKVALVGPNGAGKSTLLKIAGRRRWSSRPATRSLGHNVTVAYFAQHQVEALNRDNTVLQELAAAVDTSKVNPRNMLGAFRFSGDDVDKRVGVLSGGERSRLALAKMLANPANLLCMDEPTNHLDIASRDVLEDALARAYPGTVVLITHDRHLIRSRGQRRSSTSAAARATVYPGDFEYFAARPARPEPQRRHRGQDRGPQPQRQAAARKREEAEAATACTRRPRTCAPAWPRRGRPLARPRPRSPS